MKTIRHFIPAVVTFVLVASGLLVQASMSDTQDQRALWIQETFPNGKITDRHAFFLGAMFAEQEISKIRAAAYISALESISRNDINYVLGGLEGVRVAVIGVEAEDEKYGLTQQLLQTDTELRLRQHGIRVLTLEDSKAIVVQDTNEWEIVAAKTRPVFETLAQPDDSLFLRALQELIQQSEQQATLSQPPPCLFVFVKTTVSEETERVAFSIVVEVSEGARLSRNGQFCHPTIWRTWGVALCSTSRLKECVRECLRDTLDQFINAYLAANPKDHLSQEAQ